MSNNSSPRVPPNHPFLIRTPPPAFCKDFQARAPSYPNGPTSQFASTLRPQFGRLPAPVEKAPVFGSTDIRERKKIAPLASTPVPPLLPPANTRSKPHQPSQLGPADIHSKALVGSSPSPSSHNPTQPRKLPSVTPSGKSSTQQLDLIKYPSQCASTPNLQNIQSPPLVSHFQQSHPSWSPGSDASTRMEQDEEAIVSEALAFLQEHMRKKAAETVSGFGTLKEEVKKHHGKEDESKEKSPNSSNIPSATSERASVPEDKKNSVMDASIQELSTLLLVECQDGPAKGVEGGGNDPILVDLTDSADVLGLLKTPSQLEGIPKHFPYAMPLDVDVLHSVKEEEVAMVKDVSVFAEDPSLRSDLIPKDPPRWFSNSTCSDSSDEEAEVQDVEEAERKKKGGIAENESHAPFIAQDELLMQGFIISEPHSLTVSSSSL